MVKILFLFIFTFSVVAKDYKLISNINVVKSFKPLFNTNNQLEKKFKIKEYQISNIAFWFLIYTKYSSYHKIYHDKKRMNLVYTVLDFSKLKSLKLDYHPKLKRIRKSSIPILNSIKRQLTKLTINPSKIYHKDNLNILNSLKNANIKIPKKNIDKKALYRSMHKNIRTQTGQRDYFAKGLITFYYFEKTLKLIARKLKLPFEVLAIPFIESSFNMYARSKANATGAWQFMPRIGKAFFKINKNIDHRKNIILASIGGLQMIKQNYRSLKRWDLAISAYNSGTGRYITALRKIKIVNPSLKYIFNNYKSKYFGFASKNFFYKFLAANYALKNKSKYFKQKRLVKQKIYKIFISRIKIRPSYFYSKLKIDGIETNELNAHFLKRSWNKNLGKKLIFISSLNLNHKKYKQLSWKKVIQNRPKHFFRL